MSVLMSRSLIKAVPLVGASNPVKIDLEIERKAMKKIFMFQPKTKRD